MSPYASQKQSRFLHSQKPEIAKRWDDKYGGKVVPKKKTAPNKGASKRRK